MTKVLHILIHVWVGIANWWQTTELYNSWMQLTHPFAGMQISPGMSTFLDHFKLELLMGFLFLLVIIPGAIMRSGSGKNSGGNFNLFNLF